LARTLGADGRDLSASGAVLVFPVKTGTLGAVMPMTSDAVDVESERRKALTSLYVGSEYRSVVADISPGGRTHTFSCMAMFGALLLCLAYAKQAHDVLAEKLAAAAGGGLMKEVERNQWLMNDGKQQLLLLLVALERYWAKSPGRALPDDLKHELGSTLSTLDDVVEREFSGWMGATGVNYPRKSAYESLKLASTFIHQLLAKPNA
jgi:hypothetical protein